MAVVSKVHTLTCGWSTTRFTPFLTLFFLVPAGSVYVLALWVDQRPLPAGSGAGEVGWLFQPPFTFDLPTYKPQMDSVKASCRRCAPTRTSTHERQNSHRGLCSLMWDRDLSFVGRWEEQELWESHHTSNEMFIFWHFSYMEKMQHKVLNKKKRKSIWPVVFPAVPWLCIVSVVAVVIQRDVMKGNLILIRSWHEMLTPAKKGRAWVMAGWSTQDASCTFILNRNVPT